MLFHTYQFMVFMPIVLLAFFLGGRLSLRLPIFVLIAASLFFYGYWSIAYLPLLLGSIGFNFAIGQLLHREWPQSRRRALLTAAIAIDLGVLGYFKYTDFLLQSIAAATGAETRLLHIVLPVGISFFTFTQIAFLVDSYNREVAERSFKSYVLFVTFFPHLVAGPILHHKEMMPQFARPETFRPDLEKISIGILLFVIGLFKKVVFADSIAPHANAVFDPGAGSPEFFTAWGGALAYTFQIYFDFSGYSDMAVGLALMCGVWIPINFDSPYRSVSIVDFWRRWHMTLSRFLRDYLYIPLGGNRNGVLARYRNLTLTMLLGGLWHGASWTFVIWGGLHGLYLVIAHTATAAGLTFDRLLGRRGGALAGWFATFVAVVFAWVFFRATTFDRAAQIIAGMAGRNGVSWSKLQDFLAAPDLVGLGSPVLLAGTAFFAPNSMQIAERVRVFLAGRRNVAVAAAGLAVGVAFLIGIAFMGEGNEFLYFQF